MARVSSKPARPYLAGYSESTEKLTSTGQRASRFCARRIWRAQTGGGRAFFGTSRKTYSMLTGNLPRFYGLVVKLQPLTRRAVSP